MPFVIGGTYIFSPNVQVILGVSVDVERKYPVIPAVGLRWKLGPQWLLDAVMPTPRLQYELTRNVSLYAGATITEATFRTDDAFGDSHEFLPADHAQQNELANKLGVPVEQISRRVHELHEFNPMLGHRGCRLGITFPEISEMQARAIFEAAAEVQAKGIKVHPEIMSTQATPLTER